MLSLARTLTLAALSVPLASQNGAVSINFRGNGGQNVAGATGVIATPGWNNVNGGGGSGVVLRDDQGADRGTRLTFASASGGFQLNPPATSDAGALFDGQIITNANNGPATVTLTGVPFPSYDVFVYFGHGPSHAGRDVEISIQGASFFFQNENLQLYADPISFRQVTSRTLPGQTGNFVRIAGVTASTLAITLRPAPSGNPGSSGIAGLQIVDRGSDTDGDGLDDGWERRWFGDLSQGPQDDPDQDQLDNAGEFQAGTIPVAPDSDDDASTDGVEVQRRTDPLDPDTDDDALDDGVETGTGIFVTALDTGTDPLLPDSDGDGPRDGAEVRRGSDPNDPTSLPALPNVILILADDLGWGELGSFGQTTIRTPRLDQLAQEGMRFTQFYCGSPVCAPTRSTIQEGRHTGHCDVRNNSQQAMLDPGRLTIGRMLRNEGYTTSFIGKWGVGDIGSTGLPWDQGYDHFFGFLDQVEAHWYYPSYLWRNQTQVSYPGNNGAQGPNNAGNTHAQDEMTKEALAWIGQNHTRPFFLQLAYCIPHVSLQEPAHSDPAQAAQGRTAIDEFYGNVTWSEPNANFPSSHYTSHPQPRRAYAAMITAMDRDIGLVIDRLAALGIEDDTLILFTSDNGTSYCCGVDRQFFNSLAGLRGYKGEVYEGGIRVPTIARWPGKIAPGTTTDHVAAVWDILSTVGDVIDAGVPADLDGVSFAPTLLGQGPGCQEEHEYLYWEYAQGGTQRKAVRMGDWKGVRYGNAGSGVPLQVFDLANDPGETTNVVGQNPSIDAALERLMASRRTYDAQWFRGADEFPTVRNVTLTASGEDLQLDAGSTGDVQGPFAFDVTSTIDVPLAATMQDLAGRGANIALLLGSGAAAGPELAFELDARLGVYRIQHLGQTVQQSPFPQGTDAFARFDVICRYDPSTGVASILDQGSVRATATLTNGPTTLAGYGYRVANARAVVSPLDPSLDGRFRGAWSPFGQGCAGAGRGSPVLLARPGSRPRLSGCFETSVVGASPGGMAVGLLGFSTASFGGINLPASLDALGMTGCSLLVAADIPFPLLADPRGEALWPVPIPAAPSLHGQVFHQQAVVLDAGANPFGAVLSNAGTGRIGRP
ncbi:MAG: sulfatase-like hydrolase/transferase [Planctomycetota bacterium]|nr:sulfatase-like hydrolase/transferase [Planctomycetota bacterium]